MKTNKKRVTIIVLLACFFCVFLTLAIVFDLKSEEIWSKDKIKKNNGTIAIGADVLYEEIEIRLTPTYNYDFDEPGYLTQVRFFGSVYNCTEEVINEVKLIFTFTFDEKEYNIEYITYNLPKGENWMFNKNVGEIYRPNKYMTERTIKDVTVSYEIDMEHEVCNYYIDPQSTFSTIDIQLKSLSVLFTALFLGCLIGLVILVVTTAKNRKLVEYADKSFTMEEIVTPVPHGNERSHYIVCKYCGNEFYDDYTECPCCGARLTRKNIRKYKDTNDNNKL